MAERDQRVPENVPGRYYVDRTCIDCDLCRELAPRHFTRSDAEGFSYVFQQPLGVDEANACARALAECPVEAIGDDGA